MLVKILICSAMVKVQSELISIRFDLFSVTTELLLLNKTVKTVCLKVTINIFAQTSWTIKLHLCWTHKGLIFHHRVVYCFDSDL